MTLIIKRTGVEDYLDGGTGRIKALIMGEPGAGKTRSASFWPKPLLLDCEDGRMSTADRNIPYGRIESSDDMRAALRMVHLDSQKPPESREFLTVIVDTLDSYQRIVIQERLQITKGEAMSGWQDWGYLDGKMQHLVAMLQTLKCNVVVNLHVKQTKVGEDDDGKGGMLVQGPKLKGDMREQIGAEFDLVGHMGAYFEADSNGGRVQKRGVQWQPTPDRPGLKDRSGQLPMMTPVLFTDQDYYGLLAPMMAYAEGLKVGEVMTELETAQGLAPVPPTPGGPVAAPAKAPAKKAAAAPVTPPQVPAVAPVTDSPAQEQTPTPVAVPDVPAPPVPAAAKPEIPGASSAPAPEPVAEAVEAPVAAEEPVPTPAQAEATVAEALGGQVISEAAPAEAPEVTEAPAYHLCGDPMTPGTQAVAGCGKPIPVRVTTEDGKEVWVSDDPVTTNADIVQIATIKTRTWLCNDDYREHKKK